MPGDGEYGYSPSELLELFVKVNKENLKFIFDTGHAHVSEYDDVSYLYLLKDYLFHIHYSDNDGSRDAHARIGSGTIDFERHFEVLKEIKYNELHCMEIIHPKISDLEDYALDVKKFEE
jgi:sugar phosphate isomerase/epimerase